MPDGRSAEAAELVCGVLQIGEARVALPIDVLREVIPCPVVLDGLPAAAPGLLGAVRLRGKVVPVIDLRVVLGLPAPRNAGQVVVLMRDAGRLLGVLADAVCGLTTLARGELGLVEPSGDGKEALLFTGSFERPSDGSAISLLDPAALMNLPGLPLLRDAPVSAAAADRAAATVQPLLLVRCAGIGLAMAVTEVHATLPNVTLLPSSLDGALCRGVIEHAGVRLPAVDALALLDLGTMPPDAPCQALLLQHGSGQVALLVSKVVDIVRVPVADLAPLAPLAVRRPAFFAAGVRVEGHGEHLLLAAGALRDAPQLIALAALNTRPVDADVGRTGAATRPGVSTRAALGPTPGSGAEVITYDVGVEAASRLSQVVEVLAWPADVVRAAGAHLAAIGTFTHRGRGVTLLCLRALLDGGAVASPPEASAARVLMVEIDGARFGFVVPALSHIDRAVWERPPQAAGDRPVRTGSVPEHGLIEVQGNGHRRTLRLIDLHGLARALLPGRPAVAPAADAVAAAAGLAMA